MIGDVLLFFVDLVGMNKDPVFHGIKVTRAKGLVRETIRERKRSQERERPRGLGKWNRDEIFPHRSNDSDLERRENDRRGRVVRSVQNSDQILNRNEPKSRLWIALLSG
jgi:hypothetical protein